MYGNCPTSVSINTFPKAYVHLSSSVFHLKVLVLSCLAEFPAIYYQYSLLPTV